MNKQPIEKPNVETSTVEVHSVFYTIQGEGPFAGHPAVFVRLAGCNLRCPWCDTEYSSVRRAMTPVDVVQAVLESIGMRRQTIVTPLVVITGGEPFRQHGLGGLVHRLALSGFSIQIETNGVSEPQADFPWGLCTVVCSPKTNKIHPMIYSAANVFKYVLDADHVSEADGLPLATLGRTDSVARPRADALIYLQPADESEPQNARNIQAVVQSCLTHGYLLCLQTHKIANLP